MKHTGPLFWQPKQDFLKIVSHPLDGLLLVILNYSIWIFLFFIAFLLIKNNPNTFWQILVATFVAELFERYSKKHVFWSRPLYQKNKKVPRGLVKSWYNTGSFPSGHTTKAVYFFLFILQYGVINPMVYLSVSLPLILFRVLVGFHYPIDIFGGLIIGISLWFLTRGLIFPAPITDIINSIFSTVFFINQ